MVNTRRKSHALQSDESGSQVAEQSDSSTTSTTRRSTRRSVGNVPSTPAEIPTPTRRSRRLSNSSVESANNDTPRPAARRSTRNKPTGSDHDASDVELVVIKRRKLVEGVDTLIPISEEKTDEHANPAKGKGNHILVELDEEKEDEISQKPEIIDVQGNEIQPKLSPAKAEKRDEDVQRAEKRDEDVQRAEDVDSTEKRVEDVDSTEKRIEDLESIKEVIEAKEVDPIMEKMDEVDKSIGKCEITVPKIIVYVSKENLHSNEEQNQENFFTPVSTPTNLEDTADAMKQAEKIDCITNDNQQAVKQTDETEVATTENHMEQGQEENKSREPREPSPLEETNVIQTDDSPVKSDVEKPRTLFGVPISNITVNKTLMLKKSGKRNPIERKIRPTKKKVEPTKESLPCGADIMRNIPRGKSKSGREWKEPKSNPRYLYQDKGLKMPFEKITQLRQERQRVKELENRMKEEERARRAEITRRREINKKREEENARRGEVVQVIRNTNKIKRMKKKQLKLIQKRDTTKVV
ncbi:putative Coiled-coil domain-containing protein 86 [Daphnia magna]|uniref:Coiled-coil domain-containing protein 86 n=1 Tax=Daphnia magna TaxID=35525 RepID=A0A164SGS7_9CRUS|nr:putative Coiled-coil domain-containing protein 86 [Daphnia magna]